ncbi:MAG: Bug family tripartite tricarboxylate transporter substrate binding protein [Hyphomicrobiaceae bacterium]
MSAAVAASYLTANSSAYAQDDFFKGKTISIYIPAGPGGAYTLYARAVGQHMGRFLPGSPTVIGVNMPGAGGVAAANYVTNVAPKDGTALLMPNKMIAMTQVLSPSRVKYDAAKIQWIGSMADSPGAIAIWNNSPTKTVEGAKSAQLVLGSTGSGSDTTIVPLVMNAVLGTRFKVISGFKGISDIFLAMERGEVHGVTTVAATVQTVKPDWIADNKISYLAQVTVKRTAQLSDVPTISETAKTDADRMALDFLALSNALGRSLGAAEGVPADRVAMLRKAFDQAVHSPEYLAEVNNRKMDVNPTTGQQLQSDVERLINSPKETIERVRNALKAGE